MCRRRQKSIHQQAMTELAEFDPLDAPVLANRWTPNLQTENAHTTRSMVFAYLGSMIGFAFSRAARNPFPPTMRSEVSPDKLKPRSIRTSTTCSSCQRQAFVG